VLGANVAKETGLKLGDTFTSAHGLDQAEGEIDDGHSHDTPYRVVGIYARSGTAIDNLILTPVESVWRIHDYSAEEEHSEEGHDHAHDHDHELPPIDPMEQEMTAYLLIKRSPMAQIMLPSMIRDTDLQLAVPAIEVNRLSQDFGVGMNTMKAIAILIMLLSFISVFVSLYNSLKERKYELALMRTMGGRARKLFMLLLLEGVLLSVIGFVCGLALSRIGLIWLSGQLKESFHYSLDEMGLERGELMLFAVTLGVGIVASLLPALRAFRMDISKTLSNG